MKRITLAAMLVSMVAVLPGAASASVPQPVTFSITKNTVPFDPGAFTASGGITDSGVYQALEVVAHAGASPVIGTTQFTFTLTGTEGVLTLKVEATFRLESPFVVSDGVWQIVSGTDAYARTHGNGDFHRVSDFGQGVVTMELTGKVHDD